MTAHVYFQPPKAMEYPCILYTLDDDFIDYADNVDYRHFDGYQVTIIDRDPDSVLRSMVASLPMCRFSRAYTAEDLNHFVYNLFF
jgi:hypothetical protein